jgi:hypothetical protein
MGERFRWCEHCGAKLLSKGYYPATFPSVFGEVEGSAVCVLAAAARDDRS